jgi:hypothetical protein
MFSEVPRPRTYASHRKSAARKMTSTALQEGNNNKKFWEELIAYFSVI